VRYTAKQKTILSRMESDTWYSAHDLLATKDDMHQLQRRGIVVQGNAGSTSQPSKGNGQYKLSQERGE
jgi:hypothetical protein